MNDISVIKTIEVNASKKYEVLVGGGLLTQCGEFTKKVKSPCSILIVSDDNVYPLYGERVANSYENAGFVVNRLIFPNGEKSKNMATIIQVVEYASQIGLSKSDLIVALGGGVVGDLAGFAAAIYLRGIDFVQIPTTFLAAIDSSVGGKTGCDLPSGKNQVGVFHQPRLVICDPDTFDTLSEQVFADGICEAVKYGVICDSELFCKISSGGIKSEIETVIERCVRIKSDIVQRDEFDTGERMLLNLGHTIGHSVEALSEYEISHGHAVAIGLMYIARACEKTGRAKKVCSDKLLETFEKYRIDTKCSFSPHDLATKAMSDKKRSADTITLILIEDIGKAFTKKIPLNELEGFIKSGEE